MVRKFYKPQKRTADVSTPIVIQYFQILGPVLIFVGVMRLIVYYRSFHVNILYFLQFSEIITSVFDLLVPLIVMYTIGIVQNYLLTTSEESRKNQEIYQAMSKTDDFFERVRLHIRLFRDTWPILLVTILAYGGLVLYRKYYLSLFITVLLFVGFIIIYSVLRVETNIKHERSRTPHHVRQYLSLLFIGWYFGFIIYTNTLAEIDSVKVFKTTCGVKMTYDDNTTFTCDSTNYFIGKTGNYVFIYHEKMDFTEVFPTSRVKLFQFPKRKH